MTKAELKKKRPDVYDSWVDEGVMIERERIKELTAIKALPEYRGIPQVAAVLDKAIANGTPIGKVNTKIVGALLKVRNDPCRAQASTDESPPDIMGSGPGMSAPTKKEPVITEV